MKVVTKFELSFDVAEYHRGDMRAINRAIARHIEDTARNLLRVTNVKAREVQTSIGMDDDTATDPE